MVRHTECECTHKKKNGKSENTRAKTAAAQKMWREKTSGQRNATQPASAHTRCSHYTYEREHFEYRPVIGPAAGGSWAGLDASLAATGNIAELSIAVLLRPLPQQRTTFGAAGATLVTCSKKSNTRLDWYRTWLEKPSRAVTSGTRRRCIGHRGTTGESKRKQQGERNAFKFT